VSQHLQLLCNFRKVQKQFHHVQKCSLNFDENRKTQVLSLSIGGGSE
jgi:hypothetical protein